MRHAPNQTDIEAAKLFRHAGGMLMAWQAESGKWWWERVADHEVRDATSTWRGLQADALAIAVNDPATIGAMQAQVEAAAGCEVKLADSWSGSISQPPDRWIVRRRCTSGQSSCDRCAEIGNGGRTRGEALISARRALKGTATP